MARVETARCALIVLVACSSPAKPPPTPVVAAVDPGDLCPNEPEDNDGFQDEDGCPDPDNDQDRILDVRDNCMNDAEIYNNHEDEDGCPDRGCVIAKQFPLCSRELIFFERGKDVPIKGEIVDNIAEALRQSDGDIQLVELRGIRGRDEARMLSKQRASSIAQLLIARGVDAGRLSIVDGGVGAPAEAPNGWHRVELSIAQQRTTLEEADEIVCTPMGRYFKRLTDDERAARCR
jgi:large repetitive protein